VDAFIIQEQKGFYHFSKASNHGLPETGTARGARLGVQAEGQRITHMHEKNDIVTWRDICLL
jgi:hypothetical protein